MSAVRLQFTKCGKYRSRLSFPKGTNFPSQVMGNSRNTLPSNSHCKRGGRPAKIEHSPAGEDTVLQFFLSLSFTHTHTHTHTQTHTHYTLHTHTTHTLTTHTLNYSCFSMHALVFLTNYLNTWQSSSCFKSLKHGGHIGLKPWLGFLSGRLAAVTTIQVCPVREGPTNSGIPREMEMKSSS